MRLQRDRDELIAELFASSLPVASLLAALLGSELLLALLAGLTVGWSALLLALVPLAPSLLVGPLVASFHLERVVLRVSPERLLLEVVRPFGLRQTTRMALHDLRRAEVARSTIGWQVALSVEGQGRVYVPCASWADARRLAERIAEAQARAEPSLLAARPVEARPVETRPVEARPVEARRARSPAKNLQ